MNQRLIELERLIRNIVKIGTIDSVTGTAARVRSGELLMAPMPWLCPRAGEVKFWSAPSQGEQCLVLSPEGNTANGRILTGIFSDAISAPVGGLNDVIIEVPENGRFIVRCGGSSFLMTAESIKQTATRIDFNEDK